MKPFDIWKNVRIIVNVYKGTGSRGVCIPIVNGQTIEHLKSVGPWLAKEAQKWFKKVL